MSKRIYLRSYGQKDLANLREGDVIQYSLKPNIFTRPEWIEDDEFGVRPYKTKPNRSFAGWFVGYELKGIENEMLVGKLKVARRKEGSNFRKIKSIKFKNIETLVAIASRSHPDDYESIDSQ